jgi:large subunit ribosomal protein L18
MSKNKTYTVKFRRKREKRTDYRKRIKYISSNKLRIVLRPYNKKIIIQAVEFKEDGDKILFTVDSTRLNKYGWKGSTSGISAAYLTGLLFGHVSEGKIKEGVIDVGLHSITKGTRLPAAIKGIVDSGINVPHSAEIFPKEDVINGTVVSKYSAELKKSDLEKYKKQFPKYLKNGLNQEDLLKSFEEAKSKLLSSNGKKE